MDNTVGSIGAATILELSNYSIEINVVDDEACVGVKEQ